MKTFSIVIANLADTEELEIIKEIKNFLKEKYKNDVYVKNIFLKNR